MTVFPTTLAVVCLCVIGSVLTQTCDDIDASVCLAFNNEEDICSDQCLSKLCPRTCGKCPLKCYQCDSVSNVNDCNSTMECPADSMCIASESLGADFSMTYRLGCATNDVCARLFGSSPGGNSLIIGRRSSNRRASLNGDCCNTDLCNRHNPSPPSIRRQLANLTTTTTETMVTTTETMTTTAFINSKCADIDTAACLRLSGLNKGMCSDPCVVQACPRTCGQCSECYWCNHVKNPEQCNQTTHCETGEVSISLFS
ncbi:uncharacterized protein LOC130053264 [Ostrea edulis]|uniref:uncharacterized protein LOC130053264 n=1 Tax=Ostrea edulis TaxID=37623 RepID=UPI0024AEEDA8|nr:uncharacterized protein LOC130053264 [Ostrea edulis]